MVVLAVVLDAVVVVNVVLVDCPADVTRDCGTEYNYPRDGHGRLKRAGVKS